MRFVKLLILLAVVGFGAVKGYIWYGVKSDLDKAIAMVAPFVEINYGSIFSSLRGQVGVKDITIRPIMSADEFTIGEISFTAANIIELITLDNNLKQKQLPEYMAWDFRQVAIDFNSEVFGMMGQAQAAASESREPLLIEKIDAIGCGEISNIGLDEIIAMGYNKAVMDVGLEMRYDNNTRHLQLDIQLKDRDLVKIDVDMGIKLDPELFISAGSEPVKPSVSELLVNYNDTGYYKLRNNFCAQQSGSTVAEYVEANIKGLSSELEVVFPEETVDAYRQFMTNGGTFKVSMNPSEETDFNSLQLYQAADVMRMLAMDITINGVQTDLDKIQWKKQASGKPKEEVLSKNSQRQISKSEPAMKSPPGDEASNRTAKYKEVNKSQLKKYIGQYVRLDTEGGKRREGVLESVDGKSIRIRVRMRGGDFSFPVNADDITRARVYL